MERLERLEKQKSLMDSYSFVDKCLFIHFVLQHFIQIDHSCYQFLYLISFVQLGCVKTSQEHSWWFEAILRYFHRRLYQFPKVEHQTTNHMSVWMHTGRYTSRILRCVHCSEVLQIYYCSKSTVDETLWHSNVIVEKVREVHGRG